jgi:DNA-binding response OmpR family regulator
MAASLNIVVVEDHDALREVTVEALRSMGHHVHGVDCAEGLDDEIGAFHIDLLVVDLNLPGEDGISLARRIRAAQPEIGIIMATARGRIDDKVAGYESGADIYLTKPTSVEELTAAVQALSRRLKPDEPGQPFLLNSAALTLQGRQGSVSLSVHDAAMLAALARAQDQQLEYWQLIALYGEEGCSKSALEVKIVRLRKKLLQVGAGPHAIKSIRNHGYKLCMKLALV